MDQRFFKQLLDHYVEGATTEQETALVEAYLDELEKGPVKDRSSEEDEAIQARMFRRIQTAVTPQRGVLVYMTRRWRMAAAAVLLFMLAGGYFFFINKKSGGEIPPVITANADVEPGSNQAVLTLADGRKIVLDSTTGTIPAGNGVRIDHSDGLLSYDEVGGSDEVVYNTISTARGNQYQLQLEDGTRVWLNSASSLRYPVVFKGKERRVELTGEGYFEVAKNKSKPFYVKTSNQEIQVLGTHFNINSYLDEDAVATTLLEGSVKVTDKGKSVLLKPGNQALSTKGNLVVTQRADIDKVMAWKNGWFEFSNYELTAVMRQISRWYDVDIIYAKQPTDEKFGGRISKNLPLSAVLHLLENSGVSFRLQGKKLIVQP